MGACGEFKGAISGESVGESGGRASRVKIKMEARNTDNSSRPGAISLARSRFLARFTLAGAFVGIGVGLWEAGMIYFFPSVRILTHVDASYVIWFLAPLVALGVFTLIGAVIGVVASWAKVREAKQLVVFDCALVAAMGAYVAGVIHCLHFHAGDVYALNNGKMLFFLTDRFAVLFIVLVIVGRLACRRFAGDFDRGRSRPLRSRVALLSGVIAVLLAGLFFYKARSWELSRELLAGPPASATRKNIVIISIDSARADHFSSYGYDRPTTPNMDRMASQGVLFENAIAPSSWTLPALASVLTGMLPHQHGGDTFRGVDSSVTSLAEALRKRGYETAGFNANPFYGLSGWGIGQGFQPYDDDATSVSYNLSRTMVGRLAVQPTYQNFHLYQPFFRRSAAEVNQEIFRWFRHRSDLPYFMFINYYDVHAPYLAPPPYDERFGRVSDEIARLNTWLMVHKSNSVTPDQRNSLIAGYDNTLAYMDFEIGKLVEFLSSSPDWANTVVFITADHGEAFGEHGVYGHGKDLHREEIHVPLIVIGGHGIPEGKRILTPVATRSLFATSLDLALGKGFPVPDLSLARYWNGIQQEDAMTASVVSELDERDETPLSLTNSEWHYLYQAKGIQELYSWKTDKEEERDLSALPEYQGTLKILHDQQESLIVHSMRPWIGVEYLYAMSPNGVLPLLRKAELPQSPAAAFPAGPRRIGITQALFSETPLKAKRKVPPPKEELLRSIPYQ
jgi:arylsulfatase A-like enzyme